MVVDKGMCEDDESDNDNYNDYESFDDDNDVVLTGR